MYQNTDLLKAFGIAAAKGIGKGGKALGKAGVNYYQKKQGNAPAVDSEAAPPPAVAINHVNVASLPPPPTRNVPVREIPRNGSSNDVNRDQQPSAYSLAARSGSYQAQPNQQASTYNAQAYGQQPTYMPSQQQPIEGGYQQAYNSNAQVLQNPTANSQGVNQNYLLPPPLQHIPAANQGFQQQAYPPAYEQPGPNASSYQPSSSTQSYQQPPEPARTNSNQPVSFQQSLQNSVQQGLLQGVALGIQQSISQRFGSKDLVGKDQSQSSTPPQNVQGYNQNAQNPQAPGVNQYQQTQPASNQYQSNQYQQPPPNQYQPPPNQYQQNQPNQYQPNQPNQYQQNQPTNQYQPPAGQYQNQPTNQYQPPAGQYQNQPTNQYQPPAGQYQNLPPQNQYEPRPNPPSAQSANQVPTQPLYQQPQGQPQHEPYTQPPQNQYLSSSPLPQQGRPPPPTPPVRGSQTIAPLAPQRDTTVSSPRSTPSLTVDTSMNSPSPEERPKIFVPNLDLSGYAPPPIHKARGSVTALATTPKPLSPTTSLSASTTRPDPAHAHGSKPHYDHAPAPALDPNLPDVSKFAPPPRPHRDVALAAKPSPESHGRPIPVPPKATGGNSLPTEVKKAPPPKPAKKLNLTMPADPPPYRDVEHPCEKTPQDQGPLRASLPVFNSPSKLLSPQPPSLPQRKSTASLSSRPELSPTPEIPARSQPTREDSPVAKPKPEIKPKPKTLLRTSSGIDQSGSNSVMAELNNLMAHNLKLQHHGPEVEVSSPPASAVVSPAPAAAPKPVVAPKPPVSAKRLLPGKPAALSKPEVVPLETVSSHYGPPPVKPKHKPVVPPSKPNVVSPVHSPSPPPPPSRNYARQKAPMPPPANLPPLLDLEIPSGWFVNTSGPLKLPQSLDGLNYSTSMQTQSLFNGITSTRVISVKLKDLSFIRYKITWSDNNVSYANVEIEEYLPSPLSNPPPKDELIAYSAQYGEHVAAWCEHHFGQQIGRGECWDLAKEALLKGCGKHAFVSTYTHHGYPILLLTGSDVGAQGGPQADEVRRGDILQFYSCTFFNPETGVTALAGAPDHTSVVIGKEGKTLIVAEQNVGGNRYVMRGEVILANLRKGEVTCYRPMPASWSRDL